MRAARLHGIRDLRVEELRTPEPAAGELLVRVEACGICPTDVRKYLIGVPEGDYPFNPGHEWVGRVEALGADVDGWRVGDRVYGDTYGGYAELALLPAEPGAWSHGALALPDDVSLERTIFVEPLADCLHAVHDQARIEAGDRLIVVGGGLMGLQLVLVGALAGASVTCIEPIAERRDLAADLGAAEAVPPATFDSVGDADAVILSIGQAALVAAALDVVRPGGRVVLFAGFGDEAATTLDLNAIHYSEILLVGSEWIGTPPNQRYHRYRQALELLTSGQAPLERLVTSRCDLDGIADAFAAQQARLGLKTMLVPAGV